MKNQWKMVPVDLLRRLIAATKVARGHGSPTQLQAEWILKAPVPPAVESVLRIAADGSRIRISADGSIYPVPPAGDVEGSVADVVIFEGGKIIDGTLAYMETAVVGDRLYSSAHVTRLTAERDGLLTQCAGIYQQLEICQKQRDHRQSELTKALEELRLEKLVGASKHQQAEDFKALSWERGQELTKARELNEAKDHKIQLLKTELKDALDTVWSFTARQSRGD